MLQWVTTSRWPRLLALSIAVAVTGALIAFTAGHRYRVKRIFADAEKKWEEAEYSQAVELYESLVEEYPHDPLADRAQYQAGSIYYLFLLKEREAIQTFRGLIRRNPSSRWSVKAQGLLGEIYEKRLGDFRQALVEYQRLINLAPGGEEADKAQLAAARCYFRLGDFRQAREEYQIHLENYPDSPRRDRALAGVANCYYVRRAYPQAIRYYRMVASESSDAQMLAEAGFGIASSLEESGNLEEALEEFEKLRESYPNPELVLQRLDRIRARIQQKGMP